MKKLLLLLFFGLCVQETVYSSFSSFRRVSRVFRSFLQQQSSVSQEQSGVFQQQRTFYNKSHESREKFKHLMINNVFVGMIVGLSVNAIYNKIITDGEFFRIEMMQAENLKRQEEILAEQKKIFDLLRAIEHEQKRQGMFFSSRKITYQIEIKEPK